MTGCDDAMMVPSKQPMNCERSSCEKMNQKRPGETPLRYGGGGPSSLSLVVSLSWPFTWFLLSVGSGERELSLGGRSGDVSVCRSSRSISS